MKKFRLLLVAFAIIALMVAGLAVTVSADEVDEDTLYTVDGECYYEDDAEIPDGAKVVVYQECYIAYNPKATYTVADPTVLGASVADEYGVQFMPLEDVADVEIAGLTVTVYAPCTLNFREDVNYEAGPDSGIDFYYASFKTNKVTFYTIPEDDFAAIEFMKKLNVSGETLGFAIKLFDDITFMPEEAAKIYDAKYEELYALNYQTEYDKQIAAGCSEADAAKNAKTAITTMTNSVADWERRIGKESGLGTYSKGTADGARARVYIDVNGYSLVRLDTKANNSKMFGAYNTTYRDTYFLSSKAGGSISYLITADGVSFSSAPIFASMGPYSTANFGAAEFGGQSVPGDNLSVYSTTPMGGLNSQYNVKAELHVDGGYYYNFVSSSTAGVFNSPMPEGVVSFKNAKIYSANGRFVSVPLSSTQDSDKNTFPSATNISFENCVFYTDAESVANANSTIELARGTTGSSTVQFRDCEFITPNLFVTVSGSTTGYDSTTAITFRNCIVNEGAIISNSISSATGLNRAPDYKGNLNAKVEKSYAFAVPAFAGTIGANGYADVTNGASISVVNVSYDRIVSDLLYSHNITLASDLYYNVFVPAGITSVTVNGTEYTAKPYNAKLNIVKIAVPAQKALDALVVVSSAAGAQTLNTSLMTYVEQALVAFKDDKALVDLLYAVKDYAKAASAYAGYNVDAFTYEYSKNLTTAPNSGVAMGEVSDAFKAVVSGVYLRLDGEVKYVFTTAATASGTVSYSYYYNKQLVNKTVNVNGASTIVIPVKAVDLDSDITITAAGETLTYSLKNYVYSMSSKSPEELDKYNELMALLAYLDNYCYTAKVLACPEHKAAKKVRENVIETTVLQNGSWDDVVYCSICGFEMSRTHKTEKALLGDFEATLNEDGETYTVTGVKDKTITFIKVPDVVSEIAEGAFAGCSSLVKIDLPFAGATANPEAASESTLFGYIFGTEAFEGATATTQVFASNGSSATYYIPNSLIDVTIRGGQMLYGTFRNVQKIKYITIGDGVTTFPDSAVFYAAKALEYVILPKTITRMPSNGNFGHSTTKMIFFEGSADECVIKSVLEQQKKPDGSYYPVYYFSKDKPLVDGNFWHYNKNGVPEVWPNTYEQDNLLEYYTYTKSNDGSYTITGLTDAGKALSEIIIPEGVSALGDKALQGMTATKVVLPSTLKTTGNQTFGACNTLTEIDFSLCTNFAIGGYSFYAINNTLTVRLPNTNILIGATGSGAFRYVKVINIVFDGTIAEWKANVKVKKGSSDTADACPYNIYGFETNQSKENYGQYDGGDRITITCSDGVVSYGADGYYN